MTTMLSVQAGVPLPDVNRAPKNTRRRYPVDTMKVGEMFFMPGRSTKSVSAYISRITKNLPGKFSARHCWMIPVGMKGSERVWEMAEQGVDGAEEGTGVWRIE